MKELEFARMLATGSRIPKASGTSASQTHTLIGRVDSVSEDGLVAYVDLHGYTVEGDEEGQAVPFDNYATNISEGDDVIVQLVGEDGAGKTGYVVAAAGRGQQLTYRVDEIDEAARRATASAETAAQKAEEATASAETASEKAGQAISDAASAKAAADAAQADAKKANDAASKAQSSADSAATAASDAQASADTADANATKAIADAASASDAAAKAQASADDAAKDASAASTSAVDAGKAAATAQAAADAAQADVDETQKWFYHDTLGAHVLSSDGDNYRADVTPTALDVVDTGTGHTVASFGKDGVRFDAGYDQTIGSDDAYVRFHADTDELEIRAKSVVIGSTDVTDALTTAKSYTDSSVEQEVTARNAAIKAQADSISLDVSRTYTKSETFSAYQSDADGRIATANANASTAVSTAKTAASDAATAKTNASSAVSTANSAKSTAQTASTNASNAVNTANSASRKSDSAVSTANSASSTANAAKDAIDNLEIGGRNLYIRSTTVPGYLSAGATDNIYSPSSVTKERTSDYISIDANSAYVLQSWFDDSDTSQYSWMCLHWYTYNKEPISEAVREHMHGLVYYKRLLTSPANAAYARISARFQEIDEWRQKIKFEKGNKSTDWTPAPEDTDSAVADAKKAGTDAQSSANAAQSTADAAQSTADDAWARTLRVEVMSAPADAAGDTSLLTAYAFRGGELLSDEAVAKMGLLAWYVGGKRVATGSTYTCKAGTAAECRLEA